jgi:AcrR family transcriptional regulator
MSPSRAQGEATRERVLDIASRLFAERGFHGTVVSDITSATGLGRGALYHHIESKEDLLFQISVDLLTRMIGEARELFAAHDSGLDRVRALARSLVAEHTNRRDAWSLVITESRSLTDAHRAEVVALRDAYEAAWREALDSAADDGTVRPVDDVELRAILGMLNSTARWVRAGGDLGPEEVADRYVDLLIDGIGSR